MSAEENKTIARRFVEVLQEFFRTGDAELMDTVLADNGRSAHLGDAA